MEEYYEITSKTGKGRYVFAPGLSKSSRIVKTCKRCGGVDIEIVETPMKITIEGKGKFPDILECGEYPFLIVSKKVVDLLEISSITGFDYQTVQLLTNKGDLISNVNEGYFKIEVMNELEMDLGKMGIEIIDICPLCSKIRYSKRTWEFGDILLKQGYGYLPDLFTLKHFPRTYFCSRKVLELVFKNKLTNFSAKNGPSSFDYLLAEASIKDLLK